MVIVPKYQENPFRHIWEAAFFKCEWIHWYTDTSVYHKLIAPHRCMSEKKFYKLTASWVSATCIFLVMEVYRSRSIMRFIIRVSAFLLVLGLLSHLFISAKMRSSSLMNFFILALSSMDDSPLNSLLLSTDIKGNKQISNVMISKVINK